jgi:hypothetical protein
MHLMENAIILGVLLGLLFRLCRVGGPAARTVAKWSLFPFFLLPLNGVRTVLSGFSSELGGGAFKFTGETGMFVLLAGTAAVLFLIFLFFAGRVVRAGRLLLLLMLPMVPLTFGQGIWNCFHIDTVVISKPLASKLPPKPAGAPRVVWIVFDELDYRLSLVSPPAGIELPELNRFRQASVDAGNAFPPDSGTLAALPSLLTGRVVKSLEPLSASAAKVAFRDSPSLSYELESVPTAFADAREAGFNTAAVGWYLPYCRLMNTDLTACDWVDMTTLSSVSATPISQLRALVETSLLSPFGQSLVAQRKARNVQHLMLTSKEFVRDPDLGLILLHLNFPHTPHVYDRVKHDFSLANAPIQGYADSLVLTDMMLGELRKTMEEAHLWDNTAVLVTADHFYRASKNLDGKVDHRIPFLLKLPGENGHVPYAATFNTVLTRELVHLILAGTISSQQDVVNWLDRKSREQANIPWMPKWS